jgi:hypothetical protein
MAASVGWGKARPKPIMMEQKRNSETEAVIILIFGMVQD